MTNINLLLRPPHGPREEKGLPLVRIKPTVVQHNDMTYQIRMSFPDLAGSPDCHVRSETDWGFLGVDDGSSHGFFVMWGFHPTPAPLNFKPWCKVLTLGEAVHSQGFIPIAAGEDGMPTIRLSQVRLFGFRRLHRRYHKLFSEGGQPFHTMAWDGLEARAAMTPKMFLNQTVYGLEISVWRT
jgi:hypothetical protein